MFGGFFEGKSVLVTGLSGAKGTWLGWYLLEAGAAKVVGVDTAADLESTCFAQCGLMDEERVTLHRQDVRIPDALVEVVQAENIDVGLHLAAMAIVGECKESPLQTYSVNALGTAAFLETVWRSDIERAVVVTTDKVYRDKGGEPWSEDDCLVAIGPYAVSKACADIIAQDYYRMYLRTAGKHFAIARAGNVLVPGDHHEGRIFVDVAHALAKGEPPIILNPAFTRPYTFVGDTVSGYLHLLSQSDQSGVDGEAFNFGPVETRGIPNGELATQMCDLWGSGVMWDRGRARDEPFQHQSLDCSKAKRLLEWEAAFRIDQSLDALVQWYKAQAEGADKMTLRELTLEIIRRHTATAREQGIRWATE